MNNYARTAAAGLVLALGGPSLTGCTTLEAQTTPDAERIAQQQEMLRTKETQIARLNSSLSDAEAALAAERAERDGGMDLLPPKARAGECYARIFVPPSYSTEPVRVLKSEASERIETLPPRYEWVEERVLVKEASERLEVVPARYDWVEERVMVKEASTRIEPFAAQYRTVTEDILDKPAHTVWKKGSGPISRIDEATGEIMCLVEVPATYKTVSRRVLVKPAGTREVEIPAEFKTVRKQVMVSAPTTRKVEIPAQHETLRVKKLVEPAKTNRIAIPEEYETVTKRLKVAEGKVEWRPVLCETNTTAGVVRRLQETLQSRGHYPGPIDGVIGTRTLAAVSSFQESAGLPSGGLTIETLNKLGVRL